MWLLVGLLLLSSVAAEAETETILKALKLRFAEQEVYDRNEKQNLFHSILSHPLHDQLLQLWHPT
jgi:hypothetical protein